MKMQISFLTSVLKNFGSFTPLQNFVTLLLFEFNQLVCHEQEIQKNI